MPDNNDVPEIKAIIFDAGGVLDRAADQPIYDEAVKIFMLPKEDVEQAIHKFEPQFTEGKITEKEFWQSISEEFGVDPVPDGIHGLWGDVFARVFRPIDETLELANRLRSAGYRTGIISNVEKPNNEILKKKGFYNGFDPLIISCEVGLSKPGREIFQVALERLGLPAGQVVFTDDNENRMAGARELGMHCHHFKDTSGLEKWLKELGLRF